jgi:hypothetical protein
MKHSSLLIRGQVQKKGRCLQHVRLLPHRVRPLLAHLDRGRGPTHGPHPRHTVYLHQDGTTGLLLHGHYGKPLNLQT